jgi:KTSC domain
MRRQDISSTAIASVGYDTATRSLEVEFTSGEVYRYLHVPPPEVLRFLNADSPGAYLNETIKPGYEVVHVASP